MFYFSFLRTSGLPPNRPKSRIFLNSSLNCSGKISIFTKFWISFKLHLTDPKFHGDHEYLVYLFGSSMVEPLSLTSGILPKICMKLASELCSLYSRLNARFYRTKMRFSSFVSILRRVLQILSFQT